MMTMMRDDYNDDDSILNNNNDDKLPCEREVEPLFLMLESMMLISMISQGLFDDYDHDDNDDSKDDEITRIREGFGEIDR